MQSLFRVRLRAQTFPCVQRRLSTTGVKESNASGGGGPQDLLPHLFPLSPLPLSSCTLFIIQYHPHSGCRETAVEDITERRECL